MLTEARASGSNNILADSLCNILIKKESSDDTQAEQSQSDVLVRPQLLEQHNLVNSSAGGGEADEEGENRGADKPDSDAPAVARRNRRKYSVEFKVGAYVRGNIQITANFGIK